MNPDKIMDDPIDIQTLLEPFLVFGVGIGFPPIGGTASSQGGIKGFQVIGHGSGSYPASGVSRDVPDKGSGFRPLSSPPMSLGALVFEAYSNAFGQGFGGTPGLSRAEAFRANFKQYLPIGSFTIGNQSKVFCDIDHPDQGPYGAPKELAVLTPTLEFPQKAGSPVQQHNRPAFTALRRNVFLPWCRVSSPST
jgi:hypothetical protein